MKRLILIAAALAAGCVSQPAPASSPLTQPFMETPVAARPQTSADASRAHGKQVYDAN